MNTQKYIYDTKYPNNQQPQKTITQGPIWSDFSEQSANSQRMVRAKTINDDTFWAEMCKVYQYDFETLPLERYKVWASTMIVPIMTTTRSMEHINLVLDDIKTNEQVVAALSEPLVGMTLEDFNRFFRIFENNLISMHRIIHYAHFKNFLKDIPTDNPATQVSEYLKGLTRIVEIGAGAGEMADLCYQLGFEGEYVILDFKEVTNIQQWFHDKRGLKNVKYIHSINDLEPADLCIATWSLTEMPLSDREVVMEKMEGTKEWLIAYEPKIFGYDNDDWAANTFLPRFEDKDIITDKFWCSSQSAYAIVRQTKK